MTSFIMHESPNANIDPKPPFDTTMAGKHALNRSQVSCGSTSRGMRASARPVTLRRRRVLQVLFVDGDPAMAGLLARPVTHWGHTANTVQGSVAALRFAAVTPPDVVLLDIDSPVTTGYQLVRCLRCDLATQDCLIIAITGRTDHRHRQQCIEAGIDLVLLKPVDLAAVETLLLLESTRVKQRAIVAVREAFKVVETWPDEQVASATGLWHLYDPEFGCLPRVCLFESAVAPGITSRLGGPC